MKKPLKLAHGKENLASDTRLIRRSYNCITWRSKKKMPIFIQTKWYFSVHNQMIFFCQGEPMPMESKCILTLIHPNPVKFVWWLKHILFASFRNLNYCFRPLILNRVSKTRFFAMCFSGVIVVFLNYYIKYKCTLQFTISFGISKECVHGLAQKSHYSSIVVRTS